MTQLKSRKCQKDTRWLIRNGKKRYSIHQVYTFSFLKPKLTFVLNCQKCICFKSLMIWKYFYSKGAKLFFVVCLLLEIGAEPFCLKDQIKTLVPYPDKQLM